MRYLIFIIVSIFTITATLAQNYDFGKVSKEELAEKFHPTDSSANAAILYRSEKIMFKYKDKIGFIQERKVHERIKIYNKEGFEWATEKVYLYQGNSNSKEKMSNLKGYTYNLIDGKIKKEKLTDDGEFSENRNEYLKVNSFTLPNVKEGSVIEYRYTVSSTFIQIDDIMLQYSIPINKLDVMVSTPQIYRYKKLLNPKAYYIPSYTETKENRVLTTSRKVANRSYVGSGSTLSKSDTRYYDNVVMLSEENIPSLKAESFAGNINNYRSKMSMELEARVSLDDILEKSYATSWEKVSKTIYDSQNFGVQISKSGFYKDDLENLLEGVVNDIEKAKLIESYVKSKVKWNGINGKYTQKGIRAAYKEGEGNDADINLLVVSMLRSQGIDANPVLISTRNNGIPLFPTLDGFNYVICAVKNDDKYVLIDATEKYSGNNVLPFRVLNWQGRLVREDKSSTWIDIQPNKKSVESTMLNVKIDDEFMVTGKVAQNFTSYIAYNYRDTYTTLTNESHIKKLEKDKGDIEISNLEFRNNKDITQPVKVSYEYELMDGVDEVGDKLYFSPMLFLKTKENPFKQEERSYPIDFIIPYENKYLINVAIPEGYKVESLPQAEAIAFKDSNAKFVYLIKENGRFLQLKVQLEINNPLILPNDYKDFKDFYSKIVEKQSEQIVLTKV